MSRVAVIGSGVSGLVAAHLLRRRHDVVVFEADERVGGHTHTVTVRLDGREHQIDTGFIVFNHRTYPRFTRLLETLGVSSLETEMSFSVHCERTGLEYNGTSIDALFAQRSNLISPGFLGMLGDILQFNREGPAQAARHADATVREFLDACGYRRRFREHYLVPMGAAIWSCPPGTFLEFPIRFVMDFFLNHGMLQVQGRPVWRVVRGGSARYVEALVAPFADRIRLSTPVLGLARGGDGVGVRTAAGVERFDEVIVACHADQALRLLDDPSDTETALLGAFPYQANRAVLHTDTGVLPRARRAWAAWNYRIPASPVADVTVTYNMTMLQRLPEAPVFCVTLNPTCEVSPGTILRELTYHHPVFTRERERAQPRHGDLIRRQRTSFCGAYWGYGFHEDGVASALRVCDAFGESLD